MILIVADVVAFLLVALACGALYHATHIGRTVDRILAGPQVSPGDELGQLADATDWCWLERDEVAS